MPNVPSNSCGFQVHLSSGTVSRNSNVFPLMFFHSEIKHLICGFIRSSHHNMPAFNKGGEGEIRSRVLACWLGSRPCLTRLHSFRPSHLPLSLSDAMTQTGSCQSSHVVAERGRFELPRRLPPCRFSRAVPSTTQPPLLPRVPRLAYMATHTQLV